MGFARAQKVVDADMIKEAAEDLDMLEMLPSESESASRGDGQKRSRSKVRELFRFFRD
jgi:hypothetical protein